MSPYPMRVCPHLISSFLPEITLPLHCPKVAIDEDGEDIAGGDEEDEETWSMCEEFIKAMLINLERLPVERIQEMLVMTFDSYDRTLSELVQRLQSMVSADVITLDVEGYYSLKK